MKKFLKNLSFGVDMHKINAQNMSEPPNWKVVMSNYMCVCIVSTWKNRPSKKVKLNIKTVDIFY